MQEPHPLAAEVSRFDADADLGVARPPPASWYVDPAFLELERETTFRRHWQVVGRAEQVAEPGQYFTGSVVRRPFVVVRDGEGGLRAFYNVCAHHGTRVADGCGRATELTCPYHGWQYHLTGALKRAPGAGAVEAFRTGEVGLVPLHVAVWGPFVLVHFGEPAAGGVLAAFDAERDALALDGLHFVARREFEVGCNWKVYVDNYLDGGYHVPHLHGALGGALQLDGYRSRLGAGYSVQSCPGSGASGRVGAGARYVWLHPNFMLNRYGPWLDTNLVLPVDARRCRVVFDWYHEGAPDDAAVADALRASEQVQREDEAVVARVQEGLESGAYSGLYAAKFEAPMHAFHRLLAGDFRGAW